MKTFLVALLTAFGATSLAAQGLDFSGSYELNTELGDRITLTLTQDMRGTVRGTMSGDGGGFEIEGTAEGEVLSGRLYIERRPVYFEGYLQGDGLVLYLASEGAPGIDYLSARELVFTRLGVRGPDLGAGPPVSGNPLQGGDPGRLGNPLAPRSPAGTGNFQGTFTDGYVTLELRGGGMTYAGHLSVGGRSYPVEARLLDDLLQGTFASGINRFPITVTREDYGVTVESDGQRYFLRYVVEEPGIGEWWQRAPYEGSRPLSDGSVVALRWLDAVRGRRLYTDPSLTTRGTVSLDLELCSSGAFVDATGRGVGPRQEPRQTDQLGDGFWHLSGRGGRAVLELRYHHGEARRLALDAAGNRIELDGIPVIIAPAASCR